MASRSSSACGVRVGAAAHSVVPASATMGTDVLSDVLRAVRLTGAVYFDFELTAPWALEAPPSREIAHKVMPGAERLIEYHLIAEGNGWGQADGGQPIRLHEGDLIVFPQGHAHVISSAPGLRQPPDLTAFEGPLAPVPQTRRVGGGGAERARVVCCFLGCDERPFNPLLEALPAVIHLSATNQQDSTRWLSTLLTNAAKESDAGRPGAGNVRARLSELMFVETIRRHLEGLPPSQRGWLAGLRDQIIGSALAALHNDPAERWTVERLARAAGVSRSILAERFASMVGQPPMQYLALWRMQLASRLLADGSPIAAVAEAVGYESEAAFGRAFKKIVGENPATWRRTQRSH
jgi:AraC-like DNA-binding protein/quercetin dioxygenase-like cupin family protein